jgi:hypothetical protein
MDNFNFLLKSKTKRFLSFSFLQLKARRFLSLFAIKSKAGSIMYNVIFSMSIMTDHLTPEQMAAFRQYDYVSQLPECREINGRAAYQGNFSSISSIQAMNDTLTDLGLAPEIIGVWHCLGHNAGIQQGYQRIENKDGTEIISATVVDEVTGNITDEPIYFPFDIKKYAFYLKDVVVYNGLEIVSSKRPTIDEAKNTQVSFMGSTERDLGTYVLIFFYNQRLNSFIPFHLRLKGEQV